MTRVRTALFTLLGLTLLSSAGCNLGRSVPDAQGDGTNLTPKRAPVHIDGSGPPRGVYKVIPHSDKPTERKAITKRTIFVNGKGGTYYGGDDNSSKNISSIVGGGQAYVPAYEGGAANWAKFMTCIKAEFAPFNVEVTDVDPGAAQHIEAVIGGQPGDVGMGQGVGGVSPMTDACDLIERSVVYIFSQVFNDPIEVCEVAAQEIGHSIGMDHEYLCADPMTYLSGCGHKEFQNKMVSCGEDSPRQCMCSSKQNSVQFMLDRLGPAGSDPMGGGGAGGSAGAGGSGTGGDPGAGAGGDPGAGAGGDPGAGAGGDPGAGAGGDPGSAGTGPNCDPTGGGPTGGDPVVAFLSPADGSSLSPGDSLKVRISAKDDSSIDHATIRWSSPFGDTLYDLEQVDATTWAIDLDLDQNAQSGPRVIHVAAWDDQGNKSNVAVLTLQVQ